MIYDWTFVLEVQSCFPILVICWKSLERAKRQRTKILSPSFRVSWFHLQIVNFWCLKQMLWMLIAVSPRLWTRWPWHPRADQGHPKRLRWGRRCVTWTDGATHLHIWLAAPCPLLMATWRAAGRVQPARQRGAQNPNCFKWRERPVCLHSQKQHNGGYIWAGDRLGHRWWVMVDADLLWPIMMTVGFGLHPCICLPDSGKTESIPRDWSLENVGKVIRWLSHTRSPPIIFLSVLAMRLSFFTSGWCVLLSSVWTPDPLSLLILPLWCHSFPFQGHV